MKDQFWSLQRKKAVVAEREKCGEVADSLEVRMAILEKVKAGEITLEQAQEEIRKIKRGAKKSGKVTRRQAWGGA